jgi:hypothetical protein
MEAARRSYRLNGVRFHYFNCPRCDLDNVFLTLTPIPGETNEDLKTRHAVLESVVRPVKGYRTNVMVVVPKLRKQELT